MLVIDASEVNEALNKAMLLMKSPTTGIGTSHWRRIAPRDGLVTYEYESPVATVYRRPWRRVLFSAERDANPFFHLMESLWMLAGRNDSEWLSRFSSQIGNYAEKDGIFWGAYGHRWRSWFDIDQLTAIIDLLMKEPATRRAVMAMWDPMEDLGNIADGQGKKDHPCNTHVYFKLREGILHMTVCCRSNDIVLGCYGANAVHFSALHEFVAHAVSAGVGTYTHVSDSWHVYETNPYFKKYVLDGEDLPNLRSYYTPEDGRVSVMAMVNGTPTAEWLADLYRFMTPNSRRWADSAAYSDIFFRGVAVPMRQAWDAYKIASKSKSMEWIDTALAIAKTIHAHDWKIACSEWLQRRKDKWVSS